MYYSIQYVNAQEIVEVSGVTRNIIAREYCQSDDIPWGIWSLSDTIP